MEICAVYGSGKSERQENREDTIQIKISGKVKTLYLKGLSWTKCLNCDEEYLNPEDVELYDNKIQEALGRDK